MMGFTILTSTESKIRYIINIINYRTGSTNEVLLEST